MRSDIELLEDALCLIDSGTRGGMAYDITREIRARLAEPEDEPVRWLSSTGKVYRDKMAALMNDNFNEPIPLYRRPPRNPVHLSNTEIRCIIKNVVPDFTVSESVTFRAVARAIEQNVLEKNK